ncbi:MAG: hypothetical protein ACTS5G_03810, partial [Burkholderiales bacterium]
LMTMLEASEATEATEAADAKADGSVQTADTERVDRAEGLLPTLLPALEMDLSLAIEQLLLQPDLEISDVHMDVQLRDGNLEIEPLRFATAAGGLQGTVTANADELPASVEVALAFDDLRPARLAPGFGKVKELNEALSGHLQLNLTERAVPEHSESAGAPGMFGRFALAGSELDVRTAQGDTQLALELNTAGAAAASSRGLRVGIDGKVRGAPLQFDGTITSAVGAPTIEMRDIDARLGNSDVAGSFSYSHDAEDTHDIDAMLHSTQLDPTALWNLQGPEAAAGATRSTGVNGAKVIPDAPLNLAFLQDLNADVRYTADTVLLAGAPTSGRLELEFTVRQGHVALAPSSLQLAEGALDVEGELYAGQRGLEGMLQAEARRMDLGEFFRRNRLVKDDVG